MPQKSQVSPEKKIEVVEKYMRGEMSPAQIIDELKTTRSSLKRWVILYKTHGADGLIPQANSKKYSAELKIKVVSEYLCGGPSMKGLCLKYAISDEQIVRRWVKKYTSHKDLKQPNKRVPACEFLHFQAPTRKCQKCLLV